MTSWLSFTNHKLYQCRLLLQQAQHHVAPADAVLTEALHDAALYLLRDAYLSYLHELAEQVSYRQSVMSLRQLLEVTPLVTGEMRELQQLEDEGFSWLRQFLNAVTAAAHPNPPIQAVAPAQPGMITLLNDSQPDTAEWLLRLTQLIDAQRENRQES